MKDKFSEYYRLSEQEIKDHWTSDLIAFDANVLLNLYRYTPKTRDAFISLLTIIQDRIWVSYQVAFEYQKNRLSVISAQRQAYQEIRNTLEKKKKEIEAKLNEFRKHPYLRASELSKQIHSAFQSISEDLDDLEREHPDYLLEDPIHDRLTVLLDQRVGDDFDQSDLEKIYRLGKRRYEQKVPPGYMDLDKKKNRENRSLYGDLIVWKQIMAKSKKDSRSIIFVTDDLKEDWWYKFKGKTISARPELLREFRDETQHTITIYQADRFLEYANKNLEQKTTQDAIDEVRKVRLAAEEEMVRSVYASKDQTGDQNIDNIDAKEKSNFENAIDYHLKGVKKDKYE